MSGDVVNLRRARKAKEREAAADAAAENRLRFGKSKAQRTLETKIAALDDRRFVAHRRDPAAPPISDLSRDPSRDPSHDPADD